MSVSTNVCRDQVLAEINALPEEYLPLLLQMMRVFRQSVTLKTAEESFKEGWVEAQSGVTFPLDGLWDGIDAK